MRDRGLPEVPPALRSDPSENDRSRSRRRKLAVESAFVILLVAAAFTVRLWPMSRAHFWDEAVYLQNAEVICCGKTNYSELSSRPPLLSLVFAGVFLLWNSVYAACLVTAFLNALGPLFLYFTGRMAEGRAAAAIASLLLAFSPFFVGAFPAWFVSDDTGNSLLSDSPALTLILLSFWLLLRALRKQTDLRFASAGFAFALVVLMRFASLPSVAVLSLLVLFANRWWRAALTCGIGFATGFAPYLCWSRLRYGGFLTTLRNGWEKFTGPGESPLYYLKNFGIIFSWITTAGLALWVAQWFLRNRWQAARAADHRTDPAAEHLKQNRVRCFDAFLWGWAAVLLLFFSALRHKEARYVMPLAPPLFLLAGIGLSVLLRGRQTLTRIAGPVVLAGALVYSFLPVREHFQSPLIDPDISEEMQVSDFLSRNMPPRTVLYTNFNYPVFAYYTGLPIQPLLVYDPAFYQDLSRQMPVDGILIAYKDLNEDPRVEWLDSNPHFRRFKEFPTLLVYKYRVRVDVGKSP